MVCFIAIFIVLYIGELISLFQEFGELGMVDDPAIVKGIYSDRWTGNMGWKSCQNTINIFFDWNMLIVLSLLYVGVG